VKYGLNLSAPNIQVGVTQTVSSPALKMNVTGYHGGVANSATLDVDAPAGVDFGKLWGNQIGITTTGNTVSIADGYVPGWLSLRTPSASTLMNNQDKTARPVDIQLYAPAYQFNFLQTNKSVFTDAYVLRFDTGFMSGVPNYTSSHTYAPLNVYGISVVDEVTRNGQYRPPFVPLFRPAGQGGPWAVPGSHPVTPAPEGGVNLGSAEADMIQFASQ